MKTEEDIENKYGPLVATYENKIETLSNIISKMEDTKSKLDEKISNHEANKIDYQKQKVLLTEILKDIELKIVIQGDVTREMNSLVMKKEKLQQESDSLEVLVNKKKDYVADIDKYPAQTKLLQEEMEGFLNEHAENKKKAMQELNEINSEVKKLHNHIGVIVNK